LKNTNIIISRSESSRQLLYIYAVIVITVFLSGCANQQPPGGGEEDKTPPKVKIISPKPNSTDFRGNSIILEFSEYVDRRSFQDAFRISPYIKDDIEYNWGGKEVEIVFPTELHKIEPNKTFVINISTTLMDIHGNSITEPVSLAFSTGPKIDMGGIQGTAYNINKKISAVFAYRIDGSSVYDPTKNIPDYLTETSAEGSYKLTNLAEGRYRLITVVDEDRNLLFTSERESYGVLPYDVDVKDSIIAMNVNFYMYDITKKDVAQPELDYTKYFKDSLNIIYTSVENGSNIVLPEQSIFIFFNAYKPERGDFVNSFKITDENGSTERPVFNWKNDSLVEVFSQNRFASNRKYNISFDIKTLNDSIYKFNLGFRTVSINSFGDLKGRISANYDDLSIFSNPVRIELTTDKIVPALRYNFDVMDSVFTFKNILEAEYELFAYIDKNNSSIYDYGFPYPFEFSEPFYIYPQPISIKGGWTVENVPVNFIK
jgi:hypothetical protein